MQKKVNKDLITSDNGKSLSEMPSTAKKADGDQSEMGNILAMMEKLLHWAAIVESTDDAVISKSMEGYITSWNRGAQKLYGYTPEEIIGKPVSVLMPPEREDDFPVIMGRLRRGEKIDHYETRRKTKDGRVIDVSITVSPIRDTQGNLIGASKIARDISDRIEYQKRREDFISSASHELKTPLTTQKVYCELLDDLIRRNEDKRYMPYMQKIIRQTEKLEKLVNDLLQVSKGYMVRLEPDREPFQLEEVLEDTVTDLQQLSKHTIVMKGSLDYPVLGDRERVGQVITNLLSNAIKYSREASEIIVDSKISGDMAVVSVQDFGIGIEKRHHDQIFEKFFRLNESTYPGMGIGLCLSKEIINRHGGEIWLESEFGKGSTFYFSLPIQKEGVSPGT